MDFHNAGALRLTGSVHRSTMYRYYAVRGSMGVTVENPDRAWVSQLRKGLVELLVLGALKRDEMYGYQLLQRLAELEGLALTESTLYPVLARLTDDRLLAVRQVASPAGPPRRYYRLTAGGERRLAEMVAHWRQVNGSIDRLLGSAESGVATGNDTKLKRDGLGVAGDGVARNGANELDGERKIFQVQGDRR